MTAVSVALVLALLFCLFLLPKPPLLDDVSFSRAVFDRNGELLRLTLSADEKYRLFTPLAEISPQLKAAVLLYEDRHFYSHAGINPLAVARAFFSTYVYGSRKIGASTIPMQLARIKYGMRSRTVGGKLMQMLRAVQLELHYSKDELLEAYLNLAPYGYNVEGAGTASFVYFRQKPDMLSLPQALTLAVIPQSPARRRLLAVNRQDSPLMQARGRLFAAWLAQHPQDASQKVFFALPLTALSPRGLPFEAPQLCDHLLASQPKSPRINATIDLAMQHSLERLLQGYVQDRRESGIENASALLVDTRTMQAVASIGSADFHNRAIHGQVDGTRARRSPGSALKPFIYALALDQGLIHPMSMLADAPASFGSYTPDSFDRDFKGPIPAKEALRLSRNIPAIALAAKLEKPDFYHFMQSALIGGLRPESEYGLSLVLGGAGVTMRELAALYAMLANGGVRKEIAFVIPAPGGAEGEASLSGAADSRQPGNEGGLVSPEAAFLTLDALAQPAEHTARPFTVYYKTGTSNGFHDAWAAGVFGHYALVVWAGNFSGRSNPSLVGARTAAPLFFQMADAVHGQEPQRELIQPKAAALNLRKVNVCATTGDLSAEGCPQMTQSWFIPGTSPIRGHDIYRHMLVNSRTGERACEAKEGITETRLAEVWPSGLTETLQQAGIHKSPPPPWEAGCSGDPAEGARPVITSPLSAVEYHARLHEDGADAIRFTADADGGVARLHWFLDNRYLGASRPGAALLWKPHAGRYTVKVLDDSGRSASTRLTVGLVE